MGDEHTVELHADGTIAATAAARERIAENRGTWRILPHGGDLLILERAAVATPPPRAIAFAGRLDGPESLLGALHLFAMNQDSGALHISSAGVQRVLYLHRGKLLSAVSDRPQDRIGQVLIRNGLVTEDQIEACLGDSPDTERLGRALLRRGILTTHQVYEALRRQTQEIFAGTMFLERGVYYLVKPIDMSDVPAMLHLDIQALLLDGVRRSDELKHLRAVVPDNDVVLARTATAAPEDVDDAAVLLYRHIDAATPLSRWIEVLGLDELATVRAAAELIQNGAAHILASDQLVRARARGQDQSSRDAAEVVVDSYCEAIRTVLAGVPPDVRFEHEGNIALFIEATGEFSDLLEGVRVTPEGDVDAGALLANAGAGAGVQLDRLRRCLHELLFFLLFEVGQQSDRALMQKLHREVAGVLSQLPARLARARNTLPRDTA